MKKFTPQRAHSLLKQTKTIKSTNKNVHNLLPSQVEMPSFRSPVKSPTPHQNTPFGIRLDVHITPEQLRQIKTESSSEKSFADIGKGNKISLNNHTDELLKEDIEKFMGEYAASLKRHLAAKEEFKTTKYNKDFQEKDKNMGRS